MSDDPPRIADNPGFSKPREQIRGFKQLVKLRPYLRLLGVKIGDDLIAKVSRLEEEIEKQSTLPDRFNDLFAERGWIAYEMMHAEVMQSATEKGESGDLDGAEEILVEHYDRETIERNIRWLFPVEAFRSRESLAQLALEDYVQERYHACVPVVLMILDGVVNEVHGTRGFFYEDADLKAWDSISAHSRGLQALHKILSAPRKKTTTEPLRVPYRHGILHGQDLGYDNKLVAAKTWAALFAVRDWALAARDGRLEKPAPEPEPSLRGSLNRLAQAKREGARASQWEPRSEEDLVPVPKAGAPEDYDPAAPEAAVAKLLHLWKRRNYGDMAKILPPAFRERLSKASGDMREEFGDKQLESFEIQEIRDEAPAISEITARVTYIWDGHEEYGTLECRVLSYDEDGELCLPSSDGAAWYFWPRLVLPKINAVELEGDDDDEAATDG